MDALRFILVRQSITDLTASRMKVVTNDHQWRTSGDDENSIEFAA